MENGANQYINNQRQRGNNELFARLCDRIDRIDGAQDNGELRRLINQCRELEVSGNYQLARIDDLKTRTRFYVGGKMTIVQNFEMITSYYEYHKELNNRARFDFRVGNIEEEIKDRVGTDMLKFHVKRVGPRKRINLGLNPWTGTFDHTLEYDAEPHVKMFDDCIVHHYTVSGIDLYESTKKLLVECQKAGCNRQQLAEIIYTLVAKEMPILASSIKRRCDNPNLLLDQLYDLYTQDETLSKIETALDNEKRDEKQDIALFGARVKELLTHKFQLTQPGMPEAKMSETANRITKTYCLDVVTPEVRNQVLKVIQKKNREGREMDFAEFIACVQTLEDMEGEKYKPKTTLRVKKGLGEERQAFYNSTMSESFKNGKDLIDLTLEPKKKKKDQPRKESRGRDKAKKGKPRNKSNSYSYGRASRSPSARDSSANSSVISSRNSSAASRGSQASRGRNQSRGSTSSRNESRGSRSSRTSSRSVSSRGPSKERESHFNTDSKRRSNKPNKENYNKDRDRDSKKKSKASDSKPKQSKDKNQKICVTCATFNSCPVGKCLRYPKDIGTESECTRCKRGCHSSERCTMSKN